MHAHGVCMTWPSHYWRIWGHYSLIVWGGKFDWASSVILNLRFRNSCRRVVWMNYHPMWLRKLVVAFPESERRCQGMYAAHAPYCRRLVEGKEQHHLNWFSADWLAYWIVTLLLCILYCFMDFVLLYCSVLLTACCPGSLCWCVAHKFSKQTHKKQ